MRAFGGRRKRADLENLFGRRVAVVVIAEDGCTHDNQRDSDDETGLHDALPLDLASGDERNVAMYLYAEKNAGSVRSRTQKLVRAKGMTADGVNYAGGG
jgi:hypothetical protein